MKVVWTFSYILQEVIKHELTAPSHQKKTKSKCPPIKNTTKQKTSKQTKQKNQPNKKQTSKPTNQQKIPPKKPTKQKNPQMHVFMGKTNISFLRKLLFRHLIEGQKNAKNLKGFLTKRSAKCLQQLYAMIILTLQSHFFSCWDTALNHKILLQAINLFIILTFFSDVGVQLSIGETFYTRH